MKKLAYMLSVLLVLALPAKALALDRIGVVFTNGDLYVKEGPINGEWKQLTSGVTIGDFDLSGNYIGVVDETAGPNANMLSIKDPFLTSTWNSVHLHTAKKAAITKLSNGLYRIVVLQTDGSVVMKDGVWNSGYWSGTIETGVKDIVLGGDNVGVIMTNNDFKAKRLSPGQFSHPNNTAWQLVAQNVSEAAMTDTRVAILRAGAIIAKDGGISGTWYGNGVHIYEYATAVRLGGDKLCGIQNVSGYIEVKCREGSSLAADNVFTYVQAADFKIDANRFFALRTDGLAEVMEGSLRSNSGWHAVADNISKIELGE